MHIEDKLNNPSAFSWMKKPESVNREQIDRIIDVDVAVIGAGQAGTCAARAASEIEGTKVALIEQQDEEKQWILGVGEVGHINSKWQESQGIPKVDIDEFVNDWQLRTNNRSNYRLIRKYAEKCGECFDWLIEPLTDEERSVIYPRLKNPSPNMPKSLNGIKAWAGTAMMGVDVQNSAIKKSQQIVRDRGGELLFNARAVELIQEGNRVCGVIVQLSQTGDKNCGSKEKQINNVSDSDRLDGKHRDDVTYVQINATKGVIIAAGDYSQNRQMCVDLLTESADLVDNNSDWLGHGWDGSGIQMGVWAGGRLEPRSHAAAGGNYSLPGFDVTGSAAVLRVNKHGKRYSNEGFGTHILGALAGTKQPNGYLYGVFDSNIAEFLTYQTPCHAVIDYCVEERMQTLGSQLKCAREAGKYGYEIGAVAGSENDETKRLRVLYSADTIEELANNVFENEDDRSNFINEVKRYNELCHQGKDTDFGKEAVLMQPIEKAPFYAMAQLKDSHHPIGQSFKLLVTVSGLLIDENGQVLDDEYEPIKGLFAAGNSSGCRFGYQYSTSLPGQSISMAQTLGRETGYYVAKLKDSD